MCLEGVPRYVGHVFQIAFLSSNVCANKEHELSSQIIEENKKLLNIKCSIVVSMVVRMLVYSAEYHLACQNLAEWYDYEV